MSKRPADQAPSESVTGFVYNVSPIKVSRKNYPYFEAVLQTNTSKYHKLVCFDKKKHRDLKEACGAKRALQFSSVRQTISREDAAKTDVLINEKTQLNAATHFKVRRHSPPPAKSQPAATFIHVTDVKETPEFNKVSICAKVMQIENVEQQNVNPPGRIVAKQELLVADETGCIKLTLWAELVDSVAINKSYKFEHMSVRMFDKKHCLSASFDSKVNEHSDLANVVDTKPEIENLDSITGEICQVRIRHTSLCASCKKSIFMEEPEEKHVKCKNCGVKQKAEKLGRSLNGTITVDDGRKQVKVTIYSSMLVKTVKRPDLLSDSDKLEDFLLDIKEVAIEYGDDLIVRKMNIKE